MDIELETVINKWKKRYNSLHFDELKVKDFINWFYTTFLNLPNPEIVICNSPLDCLRKIKALGIDFNRTASLSQSLSIEDFKWIAFYDYFERIGKIKNDTYHTYMEYSKCNIFFLIPFNKFVFISRPPQYIKKDGKGRFHCIDGLAVEFYDGTGQYYIKGKYLTENEFNQYMINYNYSSIKQLETKVLELEMEVKKCIGITKEVKHDGRVQTT